MSMARKRILGFALAAALAGIVSFSSSSWAGWQDILSYSCRPSNGLAATYNNIGLVMSSAAGTVTCPYAELTDDGSSITTINEANVSVINPFEAGTSATVKACTQPWTGAAIHCGPTRTRALTGIDVDSFVLLGQNGDFSGWTPFPDDYAYYVLGLPKGETMRDVLSWCTVTQPPGTCP
jgi:hypothetical protein